MHQMMKCLSLIFLVKLKDFSLKKSTKFFSPLSNLFSIIVKKQLKKEKEQRRRDNNLQENKLLKSNLLDLITVLNMLMIPLLLNKSEKRLKLPLLMLMLLKVKPSNQRRTKRPLRRVKERKPKLLLLNPLNPLPLKLLLSTLPVAKRESA